MDWRRQILRKMAEDPPIPQQNPTKELLPETHEKSTHTMSPIPESYWGKLRMPPAPSHDASSQEWQIYWDTLTPEQKKERHKMLAEDQWKRHNPPEQPNSNKRPLTEYENSIRTRERMEEDWKKYNSFATISTGFDEIISKFYDKWKNAPPPPNTLPQPQFTFEFIYNKVVGYRSAHSAISLAKFIADRHLQYNDEVRLLSAIINANQGSTMNRINFLLAAPPINDIFPSTNSYMFVEYLRVLDQTKFDNVVKILHKYGGVISAIAKNTIYEAIAQSYASHRDAEEWNKLLAGSNLDISPLVSKLYRQLENYSHSENTTSIKSFLDMFIDRISTKAIINLFYNTIDNDKSSGIEIFRDVMPKKPDIDRVEIVLDGMQASDIYRDIQNNELNHYTVGELTKLLNADETNRLEQEYIKLGKGLTMTLIGLLRNHHSNKDQLYNYIAKLGPQAAKGVLVHYNADEEDVSDEDKKMLNVPALQKIIERTNSSHIIAQLIASTKDVKGINFPSAKRKYNELKSKEYAAKPEDQTHDAAAILKNFQAHIMPEGFLRSWVELTTEKKDWFFCDPSFVEQFFYNQMMMLYAKYKPNSAQAIYHDIKANYDLVNTMRDITNVVARNGKEGNRLWADKGFIDSLTVKPQNFAQYVRYCDRVGKTLQLMHNTDISDDIAKKIILNPAINLDDKTVEEFIEILDEMNKIQHTSDGIASSLPNQNYWHIRLLPLQKANANLVNETQFMHNIEVFERLRAAFNNGEALKFMRGSQEHAAIKQLHTQLEIIEQFDTIKEYIADAKPKDKRMFELNWQHPSGLKFEVMGYLDPAAFSIGATTGCCQRIGGEGEDASIDSFINPMASVLVVSYDGNVIGQSYFHITNVAAMPGVPAHGTGIILDNVEHSEKNQKAIGLTENALTKAYADWAAAIKANNKNITYIVCGKDYSKINNSMFGAGTKMKEDPREFAVDEPYSDFDEADHLDLLKPSKDLEGITVQPTQTKRASIHPRGITKGMVRQLALAAQIDLVDLFVMGASN